MIKKITAGLSAFVLAVGLAVGLSFAAPAVATHTAEHPYIPYAEGSFFTKRLPPDAPVDAASAAGIQFAYDTNRYDWPRISGVEGDNWGNPFFFADCSDPIFKVSQDSSHIYKETEFLRTQGFHAPEGFYKRFTLTGDSPATIIDRCGVPHMPNGMVVWLYGASHAGGYVVKVKGAGAYETDSNGLDRRNALSSSDKNFTTNRGNILGSETVRGDLLDYAVKNNTDLGHVLEMFWTETRTEEGYVHPMIWREKNKYGWGPQGIRIRVKPGVDLDARPDCNPAGKAIAKTLQNYGAILGDNSGSDNEIKADQGLVYPGLTRNALKDCITYGDMEFVERGYEPPASATEPTTNETTTTTTPDSCS